MAQKVKIKIKRGKLKVKLKSDDALLHAHDDVRALLGAATSAAMQLPTAAGTIALEPAHRRALPASVGVVNDSD